MSDTRALENIQVARGIAAIMVVIQHSVDQMHRHAISGMVALFLFGGSAWGSGVDIFFVISGFIMLYITTGVSADERSPLRFFRRRLVRVAPIYWLFTMLMILSTKALPGNVNQGLGSWWHIISSFLFIPSQRSDGLFHPILGLGWTLNYEFFFYSCFALSLSLPRPGGMTILSLSFLGLAMLHGVAPTGPIAFWSEPIIIEFLFGMGIAWAYREGHRLTARSALMIGAGGLVLTFALPALWSAGPRILTGGIPAMLLIAAFALAPQGRWWRPAVAVGNASYSLYLSHPFVLNIMTMIWKRSHLPASPHAYLAVMVGSALASGYAVFRFVEEPIRRRLAMPRRRGTTLEAVPA